MNPYLTHVKIGLVRIISICVFTLVWIFTASAQGPVKAFGQTVYVPVYSHIADTQRVLGGDRSAKVELATNISVRNTDAEVSITILKADYFDSHGKLIRSFIKTPLRLAPMASTHFLVRQTDTKGGVGANGLVSWSSISKANAPIIESVTFGTQGQHAFSFVSRGTVTDERTGK